MKLNFNEDLIDMLKKLFKKARARGAENPIPGIISERLAGEIGIFEGYTSFAGDLVKSSGNIDFGHLSSTGDFRIAKFNKIKPRIKEALDMLITSVFRS